MGRKNRFLESVTGDAVTAADAALLSLATVPALASNGTVNTTSSSATAISFKQVPGPVNKLVITLSTLVLDVTDDGSTGHAAVQLVDFPPTAMLILGVSSNVTGGVTTSWAPTTPVMSLGSAVSGTNATLTGTEADVVPSTSLTIASNAFTFAVDNPLINAALTDSSGGTASDTIASISTAYAQSEVRNAVASLAAKVNVLMNVIGGAVAYNGTDTAKDLYLNFACNSDPSTSKQVTLNGTITITWISFGDN